MSDIIVFLFHRDLRLEDNKPLQEALNYAKINNCSVLPVFIFTPEQVGSKSPIRSLMSVASMIQSLKELDEELHKSFNSNLCYMYGDNVDMLQDIDKQNRIIGIFETKDYTPYAQKRELSIDKWCKQMKIDFHPIDYLYMFAPGDILNKSKKIYQKFTPFYETAKSREVPRPLNKVEGTFVSRKISSLLSNISLEKIEKEIFSKDDKKEVNERRYKGGRKEGLYLLKNIPSNYNKIRDMLPEETSGLSVHHHFGTISIRETYWVSEEMSKKHPGIIEFQRQLYWRDFYGHIISYFEDLYGENAIEFQKVGKKLTKEQEKIFYDWCDGNTGIELVDAGMRQMNQTGFMHNRARLVVSSWLCKDMEIHWRLGERYFASKLVDYDFSQNMGNWAFQASVLPFSRPPFRRDDPVKTSKRLDPENEYIDKWLY